MVSCKHLRGMSAVALVACTLVFASIVTASEKTANAEINIGSISLDTPLNMIGRVSPLAKYLSEKIGSNVVFRPSTTFGNAIDDLGSKETQIAYLTPAAYLEAREKYGVIPLVKPINQGKSTFTLKIFVRKDSSIVNSRQLSGRTFAFGDKKSRLQQVVVESTGLKLNDFSTYSYLQHQDNIVKAVIHGDFDAGIAKDTVLEKFAGGELRVIHTSPPFIAFIFAANKELSPAIILKLKRAFLELNSSNKKNAEILSMLEKGYTGFDVVQDNEFDGIRKLFANSAMVVK